MPSLEPRFVRVSRRAFLARSAIVGGLLVVPELACAKDDAEVFARATTTTPDATAAPSTATTSTSIRPGTSSTAGAPTTVTTAAPTTTTQASAAAATFPAGGELVVAFTFAASGGGRVNNPFIAVWVEDPDGNLVDTISLWFEAGKGARWLPDLRRWYAASDDAADTTMSGATRVAGSYKVAWDGTDLDGRAVAAGDYVVHIEAAREHGPYELVTGRVTISDAPFESALAPSGELTAATVGLVV